MGCAMKKGLSYSILVAVASESRPDLVDPVASFPGSVRSCSESGLDPVEHVIPVILNLIVERANGRTVCACRHVPAGACRAGGNPVDQAIEHDEIFIVAGSVI